MLESAAYGIVSQIAAPAFQQAMVELRYDLGWDDLAQTRAQLYRQNWRTASAIIASGAATHESFQPLRLTAQQAVQLYNQQPWQRAYDDVNLQQLFFDFLKTQLQDQGINIGRAANPSPGAEGTTAWANQQAELWMRMIEMSSQAAPLQRVITDYYRSVALEGDRRTVDESELNFNLQRGQYRRQEDRNRLMEPFATWGPDQITQLRRLGVITEEVERSLLQASGLVRLEDRELRKELERRLPDPSMLIGWAARGLWAGNIVNRLSLDEGYNDSPVAKFFAKVAGIGEDLPPLPGQPEGETDWAKMSYRATRHLPTFAEARQMQWRLRRGDGDGSISVIAGIPTWTEDHTAQVLHANGTPEPIAKQMLALVPEPMPLHILATVLTPLLEHITVRQIAQQVFPGGEDWLKNSLRDHGFDSRHVTLISAAMRQEAEDKANAEMIANKKRIREENRAARFEAYRLGVEDDVTTRSKVVSGQFTEDMANDTMAAIEVTITNKVYAAKIGAIQEAFMSGQKNTDQTKAAFDTVGIAEARRDQYIEEWTWSRTTNQRHLVTGEIMQAMKQGIMTPMQAAARLTNLGWTQADAMVEVQVVMHELQVAQQHLAAHNQAVAQAAAAKARHEQQVAAEKAKVQAAHAQAIKDHTTHEVLLATHAKLRDQSEYFAKVHAANSDFAKAAKSGDQEKQAAELAKELAAYHDWLLQQQALINEGRAIANVIGPIQTQAAAGPQPSQGAASAPSAATPPSGGPGKPGSGNNNPPTP